jgi:hypothetical protein
MLFGCKMVDEIFLENVFAISIVYDVGGVA